MSLCDGWGTFWNTDDVLPRVRNFIKYCGFIFTLLFIYLISPLFLKAKFCFVAERLYKNIVVVLLPCSADGGRTNWIAPLDFSWAKSTQGINSPGQEISPAGWIWENHNTSSCPPVWLGALCIANHCTPQSCISEGWIAEYTAMTRSHLERQRKHRPSRAWDFSSCNFQGGFMTSGFHRYICSLQVTEVLDLVCDLVYFQVTKSQSWWSLLL